MVQGIEQTYEGMFLVNAATAAEDWEGVMATIERIMQRSEAAITKIDKWDERRLCYSVSGQKRGTYILCYFTCHPDAIGKIERDVQLNETILRVLILRADRIPQLIKDIPTPYMQVQQQKQAAKVKAAESDSFDEEGSLTDELIPSIDDLYETKDSDDNSGSDDAANGDIIPTVLETHDNVDESSDQEDSQTKDIDETGSLPG